MKAKLKIFKGLELEELEQQVSNFLESEASNIIKIDINQVKISKIVDVFETEVDAFDCILLYVPIK